MKKGTVLIADDEKISIEILSSALESDYNIITASNGDEAIKQISENGDSLSIVILDIVMPVLDGFGVVDYMKQTGVLSSVPVIMITSSVTPGLSLRCYSCGVFDIIEKPFDLCIVKQRVSNAVELYLHKNHLEQLVAEQTEKLERQASTLRETIDELRTSEERFRIASVHNSSVIFEFNIDNDNKLILDGIGQFRSREMETTSFDEMISFVHPEDVSTVEEIFVRMMEGSQEEKAEIRMNRGRRNYRWYSVTLSPMYSQYKKLVKIIGSLRDINTQYLETADLRNKAQVDLMTGLLNHSTSVEKICAALSKLDGSQSAAFLIFDIDDFKRINDRFGHSTGDSAIISTAHLIRSWFSHSDIVGRLGGDEFVVYLEDVPGKNVLEKKFGKLLGSIREQAESDDSFPVFTVSAGAVIFDKSLPFESVYKTADDALYKAKSQGKGKIVSWIL